MCHPKGGYIIDITILHREKKIEEMCPKSFFLENKKYYAVWLMDVKYLFKSLEDSMLSTWKTLENPVISI